MKLTELEPRWLTPNVLAFQCPHCRKVILTCKNIVLSEQDQFDLFHGFFGEDWNIGTVPSSPACAWSFSGTDFASLTVEPSVDASSSGHWHGRIVNGEMV